MSHPKGTAPLRKKTGTFSALCAYGSFYMFEQILEEIFRLGMLYLFAGFLFALVFVTIAVPRIDPDAKNSGAAFRLVIFPGSVALWPLIVLLWICGRFGPLKEKSNCHDKQADSNSV